MVDLNNRKYKEVVAYDPGNWVCFEMENGLAYIVLLDKEQILVRVHADSFLKFDPYCESGKTIPKADLAKADKILRTAKLPEYDEKELRNLDRRVQYKNGYGIRRMDGLCDLKSGRIQQKNLPRFFREFSDFLFGSRTYGRKT